jgi:Tfp pilus assembly protein PilF
VSPDVTYEEADSAFTARRYDEATEMFAVYVGRRPDNPWGHYMLGLSAWKSGQFERARAAFEDALTLDPSHVKSLVNLSRVMLDDGKPNEALARIRQAVALDSTNGDAYRVLGRVHGALGHTDDAVAAYRTALALDPDDTWSMNNMGFALVQAGRYEEALGPLARAVQIDEHGVPQFRNNLGLALERTGRFARAESLYREALSLDSGYTKAAVSLARVEGRSDASGVPPVEISALGDAFAATVLEWRIARGLTEDTGEVADTVPVEQRVSKVDRTRTPR